MNGSQYTNLIKLRSCKGKKLGHPIPRLFHFKLIGLPLRAIFVLTSIVSAVLILLISTCVFDDNGVSLRFCTYFCFFGSTVLNT